MEVPKLRFVRCPRCLQLLVEYPSIPVYQCGGCGTVLRAKNRVVSAPNTNLESAEHNTFPNCLEGLPQNKESICSDEQKIASSLNAQPSENVVEENISFTGENAASCESVNEEKSMHASESTDSSQHVNRENCSQMDMNDRNSEAMAKDIHGEGSGADSYSDSIRDSENVDTCNNINEEKISSMDNEGVGNEDAIIQSMPDEGLRADSNYGSKTELKSITDQKCSFSNDNASCQKIAVGSVLDVATEPKSDHVALQEEERSIQYEGFRAESHEDLIEELERSLSYNDDDEDFVDVVDSNGLHDALHYQIGSRRFSSVGKMNDAFHSDPHDRLIEELERSFSDAEEPLDDHAVVTDEGIAEVVHGNEPDKDLHSQDTESADPYEGSISSLNDGRESAQNFQAKELPVDDTKEKEESYLKHDKTANNVEADSGAVVGFLNLTNERSLPSSDKRKEEISCRYRASEKLEMSFSDAEEPLGHHAVATDQGLAERVNGNEHDKDLHSPDTESANPYEGSISSLNDEHLESAQTFQAKELTVDDTKEKEESYLEYDETANIVEAYNGATAGFSNLTNDRFDSTLPRFDKRKEEFSYRYRARELHQGLSLDSEDFHSIQNFIESQMDGASSSLSSGSPNQGDLVRKTSSKFKNIDRFERLKKMDELRDQLSRLSSWKGLEKRYQSRYLEHQPQLNSYKPSEQLPQSFDAHSIPSSCTLEPYHDHGKPPRYPPPIPFSPPHSCTHCHFGHRQPYMMHNCNTLEYNSYYQSSYAGSAILDHESLKSSYREQIRAVRKHILRPLSGASPFTVCNGCFNLLQMPSDIYISKRKSSKMQCGQCAKVLVLSLNAMHYPDAKISKELAQQPRKPLRDPVSINEEYGVSFTRSFSSKAEPVLGASISSKRVSESALHRLMGYDSASQLLRHSRVFDDGYESFESMVPVSNRVSKRKNL